MGRCQKPSVSKVPPTLSGTSYCFLMEPASVKAECGGGPLRPRLFHFQRSQLFTNEEIHAFGSTQSRAWTVRPFCNPPQRVWDRRAVCG